MNEHVSVAESVERLARKQEVLRLGLLEANDFGRPFRDQAPYIVQPEADRVDVPGDEAHRYGSSELFGWDRIVEHTTKTSAPGRGGRPGAYMSEAFGGN